MIKKLQLKAPGRINLLGEHLDYNHGVVLPAAIDRCIEFQFVANSSQKISIEALDLAENWEFEIAKLPTLQVSGWRSYAKGVFLLLELEQSTLVSMGLNIRFKSDIPIGAGLSSSAALCCGMAFGLNEFFELGKTRFELALVAQQTEHQFAGVKCGLMDQVASLFGQQHHLLAFDCLTQEINAFSLPLVGVQLFLIDSKVKHNLAESAYNERRAQLEDAFNKAILLFPELKSWRAIEPDQVSILYTHLDTTTQKRLRYVLEEINRVKEVQKLSKAIADLVKNGNSFDSLSLTEHYQQLGKLLNETHAGLSDLYEVSCLELDFLQHELLQNKDILGARMMGGGFGGCLLVLAQDNFEPNVSLSQLFKNYTQQFGIQAICYPIQLAQGVHLTQHDDI
ncbi:MAG: galactokinase [Flavobacteriales bacterium]